MDSTETQQETNAGACEGASPDPKSNSDLRRGIAADFVPRRFVHGGHAQTLVGHFLPRINTLPQPERRLFQVEKDVQILCFCNWQKERAKVMTAIIVHGLEGSSESQYVIGTANKAWASGMNVVRMNVRSCGGSEALSRTMYHSGMSSDIAGVIRELIKVDGAGSIGLAGFSMGGNQVLKLAGEWGSGLFGGVPPEVRAVVAISPAMDLSASSDALHDWQNRVYEWQFLWSLRASLRKKCRLFPDCVKVNQWWWQSVRDFDDRVTATHFGFRDAEDYYTQASSAHVLEHVAMPTLVVYAKDDPFIRVLPETRAKLMANPNIACLEVEHGGHCGFLAEPDGNYDGRWAERKIVEFFRLYDA